MTVVVVLGAGAGLAFAVAVFGLVPSPPPLRRALLDLHRRQGPPPATTSSRRRVTSVARAVRIDRLIGDSVRADLAVVGRDDAWLASRLLRLASVGLVAGPLLAALSVGAGVRLPWGLAAGVSVVGGPTGGLAPFLSLRSEAGRCRQEYGMALSAFVDLVVVAMAAGLGTEAALSAASRAGSGPVFDSVRDALDRARLRGLAPWDALDELAGRLSIADLRGLAASIRLAGASGAKVRQSLAARAKALRARSLADSRAAAESETERMSVPVVLLVLGFVVLVGYPAVVQITTQL